MKPPEWTGFSSEPITLTEPFSPLFALIKLVLSLFPNENNALSSLRATPVPGATNAVTRENSSPLNPVTSIPRWVTSVPP